MGGVNCEGVWRYIRHPNYLGEILMWWGVYFMMLSADASLWPALIGPLCNTLLFVTVSIPLMEGRQLRNKPGYSDYRARTGMLLPRLPFLHR
jgi:steroid 5-alpha reductase family enzyme